MPNDEQLGTSSIETTIGTPRFSKTVNTNVVESKIGEFNGCDDLASCEAEARDFINNKETKMDTFPYDYDVECQHTPIDEIHYYIIKRRQRTEDKPVGHASPARTPCDDKGSPMFFADGKPAWGEWIDACDEDICLSYEPSKGCESALFPIGSVDIMTPYTRAIRSKEQIQKTKNVENFCLGFLRTPDEVKKTIERDIQMESRFQRKSRKSSRVLVQHKVKTFRAQHDGYTCNVVKERVMDWPEGFTKFKFSHPTSPNPILISLSRPKIGPSTKVAKPPSMKVGMKSMITKGEVMHSKALSTILEKTGFKNISKEDKEKEYIKKIPYQNEIIEQRRTVPELYCTIKFGSSSLMNVIPYAGYEFLATEDFTGKSTTFPITTMLKMAVTAGIDANGMIENAVKNVPEEVAKECDFLISRAYAGAVINIKNYPRKEITTGEYDSLVNQSVVDPALL